MRKNADGNALPGEEVRVPADRVRRESLRVFGIVLVIGLAVNGAALVAFSDAVRQRHIQTGDPQELVAFAGVAQPLGRTRTLQRLSSVPVTPCHGDIPILECVEF
jgi:hypothetical protein